MAHSVARLSPNYCCDGMRWRSLGSSEAAWWQRYVLAVMGEARLSQLRCLESHPCKLLCA
jgi:hypothetical protein